MSKLRSHLACLVDPGTRKNSLFSAGRIILLLLSSDIADEKKLKAAQEVSENLEVSFN